MSRLNDDGFFRRLGASFGKVNDAALGRKHDAGEATEPVTPPVAERLDRDMLTQRKAGRPPVEPAVPAVPAAPGRPMPDAPRPALERATRWVEVNPSVREEVLARLTGGRGEALPDLAVDDPVLMLDAIREMAVEAVRRDAPDGVVEELLVPIRRMAPTVGRLDQLGHTLGVLARLQGLRDRAELEPVLEQGLAAAPDEANRDKLAQMLAQVRRSDSPETAGPVAGLAPTSDTSDVCCSAACLVCGRDCLLCCVTACFLG